MARMSRYQGWRKSLGCKLFEKSPFYSFECPSQHFVSRSGSTGAYTKRLFFLGLITPSSASLICSAKPTDLVFGGVFCRSFHGIRPTALGDFYKTMGVNKDARPEEIKKAYFALSKKLHSCTNQENVDTKQSHEVQFADKVLKNEEKHLHSRQVLNDDEKHPYSEQNQFFRVITSKEGGKDIKGILELSLIEVAQGCEKTLTFQADVLCQSCNGTGVLPGTVPQTCNSSEKDLCKTCNGQRIIKDIKSIKIEVMPGVDNDEIITIHGGGGADADLKQPGDLNIIIKVLEHPLFWRDGNDIHTQVNISVIKVMLRRTIHIPTVTGEFKFQLYPNIQPDHMVVLRGQGIKKWNSPIDGDLYVHFTVFTPVNLTERQRMLIEEFRKEEGEFFWHQNLFVCQSPPENV